MCNYSSGMDSHQSNKNYRPCRDPMELLSQEMCLRNFSSKTIKSYTYYTTSCLKQSRKDIGNIISISCLFVLNTVYLYYIM